MLAGESSTWSLPRFCPIKEIDFFILGVLGPPSCSSFTRPVLLDEDEEEEAASDEIRTRRVAGGSIAISSPVRVAFFCYEGLYVGLCD